MAQTETRPRSVVEVCTCPDCHSTDTDVLVIPGGTLEIDCRSCGNRWWHHEPVVDLTAQGE